MVRFAMAGPCGQTQCRSYFDSESVYELTKTPTKVL